MGGVTSIQGFAELFRLGVANEHVDTDVIMRRIEEESRRMRVLIDDLLLLARLDERRDIEPTRVDLAVLAADACSDAVAADPDRHITLDAASVPVDGVQDLRQAIANLVSNAVTHTPDGTAIEVAGCRRHRRSEAGRGLSIVAAIAASHGGTATVANHPDGGAIFTVDLPVATGSAPVLVRTTEP